MEGLGQIRIGRDGLGSRFRLGQSFFARATRSCFVSGMLDCLQNFCCIGSSNRAKKSITSILARLLTSFSICVLRLLNRRNNVSSDSLDAFLACTQSSHEVWTRWAQSPQSRSRKSLRAIQSSDAFFSIRYLF